MDSAGEYWVARAALDWQAELGVTETLCETPVDRYALAASEAAAASESAAAAAAPVRKPREKAPAAPVAPVVHAAIDAVAAAQHAAAQAHDLAGLRAAMDAFEHCDLRRGARQLVFADGVPGAPLMIIGEAPGRDEDREGKPFVGRAGQLLDLMLAAIDRSRTVDTYITNVIPWRPPQNRDPSGEEIAMMLPFLQRHVVLAQPKALIVMGNIACDAVLGRRGITRLRGHWAQAFDLPVMPMLHPAYLLGQPEMKRHAWADLLEIRARLATL